MAFAFFWELKVEGRVGQGTQTGEFGEAEEVWLIFLAGLRLILEVRSVGIILIQLVARQLAKPSERCLRCSRKPLNLILHHRREVQGRFKIHSTK
jgi:hypothetical protein